MSDREKSTTMEFTVQRDRQTPKDILLGVYEALEDKGYDAVNQIVGYLICGDPTYITSYNNARYNIRLLERDELLEELVRSYIKNNSQERE
ncbi:MAG: IreB family regulatory phosphoprotein [Clostridia bacterium]|nr:IreB family regulatory phosphoprotein [Clostridia bacterium]